MKSGPSIKLDFTNVMAKHIGSDNGITDKELNTLKTSSKSIIKECAARFEKGEIGFMKLPFNTSAIEEINAFAVKHKRQWDNLVVIGIGGSSLGLTMIFDEPGVSDNCRLKPGSY